MSGEETKERYGPGSGDDRRRHRGGRSLLGGWLHAQLGGGFPWGTFAINAIRSLLIGAVFGLAQQDSLPPTVTLFLTVGVLGGFATFSASSYETLELISSGAFTASLLNVAGQFAVSLVAVYLSFAFVRLLPALA